MDMIKFKHKMKGRKTMTNGERIKYLREKNGFTQKEDREGNPFTFH